MVRSTPLREKSLGGPAMALLGMAVLVWLPPAARAQDAPPFAMGNGRPVQGTVTAVAADHLTLKTPQGDVYQVSVTPNTRVMKGREPMKFADVRVGDGVGAMGEIDAANKTVHAVMMTVVTAEELQKAKDAMGKTFISGSVTAIDELKLTIKRTDGIEQVIAVDEDTSFRRGGVAGGMAGMIGGMGSGQRPAGAGAGTAGGVGNAGESITLADVKVGSMVAGPGTLKNGTFVPTTLGVSDPGAARQRRQRDGAGTPATTPTTPPPTTPPPGMELR
jgi:hypothetical protein